MPQSLLLELGDIRSQLMDTKAKIDRYGEYQLTLELPVSDIVESVKQVVNNLEQLEVSFIDTFIVLVLKSLRIYGKQCTNGNIWKECTIAHRL